MHRLMISTRAFHGHSIDTEYTLRTVSVVLSMATVIASYKFRNYIATMAEILPALCLMTDNVFAATLAATTFMHELLAKALNHA